MAKGTLCLMGGEIDTSNSLLMDAAKKRFESVDFVPINEIVLRASGEKAATYNGKDILDYDAVLPRIPRDNRRLGYHLLMLYGKRAYTPISPTAFLIAMDRLFLFTILRNRKIPTINLVSMRSRQVINDVVKENIYPAIIRVPKEKTGIYVTNERQAKNIISAIVSLKQQVIAEQAVTNLKSIYVFYPDIISAVEKKTKDKDIVLGKGKFKKTKVSEQERQIAHECSQVLGADMLRVDITNDRGPKIVNIHLCPSLTATKNEHDAARRIIESLHDGYERHASRPQIIRELTAQPADILRQLGL